MVLLFVIVGMDIFAQSGCVPRELPYYETFDDFPMVRGDNDTVRSVRCWRRWCSAPLDYSLSVFEYVINVDATGSNAGKMILFGCGQELVDTNLDSYVDMASDHFNQMVVTPPLAECPVMMVFRVGFSAKEMENLYLEVGYLTNPENIGGSFIPLDTLIYSNPYANVEGAEFIRPLYWIQDTLIIADTLPPPVTLAFRLDTALQRHNYPLTDTMVTGCPETVPYNLFLDIAFLNNVFFFPRTHIQVDLYDTICQGAGYVGHGFDLQPEETLFPHTRDSSDALNTWHYILHLCHVSPYEERYDMIITRGDTLHIQDTLLADEGEYTFRYSSIYGCDSIITIALSLTGSEIDTNQQQPTETSFPWAPNAFTPDGETNRLFVISGKGIVRGELYVYNRFGLQVCHQDDYRKGWDGTCRGRPCKQDSYVWHLVYRTADKPQMDQHATGTVTLLR